MQYSRLYDLIQLLQRGTRLHIGVLLLNGVYGDAFALPSNLTIHSSEICWSFKSSEGGFERCYRCRQMAIEKALREQRDFGGFCINGVYEYTRPVVIDGEVAAIIYVGNILKSDVKSARLLHKLREKSELIDSMEQGFDEESCRTLGRVIESYILALHKQETERGGTQKPSFIENAKAYIAENLEYDVSISDMARLFHYNEQYLGRLFKRETGMSFSEYINCERVKRAALLLKDNISVTNASFLVGFNNVTYFNRIFKRHFGCSPTEYKRNLIECNEKNKT